MGNLFNGFINLIKLTILKNFKVKIQGEEE